MKRINALIIDPGITVREMLSDLLQQEEGIKVAGEMNGESGEEVKKTLREALPDVILLGINRIESRQMELLEMLRQEYTKLPVIVLTPHNREGATIALTGLKWGAVEYINKTVSQIGSLHTREHFKQRLIPVIKAVNRLNREVLTSKNGLGRLRDTGVPVVQFAKTPNQIELVVFAGCLGGVPVLYQLLSSLPENLPVPAVIVQHMPKIYTEVFAEDLNRVSVLNVQEAKEDVTLKSGHVYVAPGGFQTIVRDRGGVHGFSLLRGPVVKGYRPSMDVLLQSIRNSFEDKVMVIYLSGGGQDGIEGAKVIDELGGQIIIQNQSSSLLWDLPWKIKGLGIHRGVYPLNRLGDEITQRLI
ncbi:MAG: chemotaxis protein CheB [Balneolaceae bacterium]